MAMRPAKSLQPITFETESEVYESTQHLIASMMRGSVDDQVAHRYLSHVYTISKLMNDLHKKNVSLLEISQHLNADVLMTAAKIDLIRRASEEDMGGLTKLKESYEEASRMVRVAHQCEVKSHALLTSLRSDLDILSTQIENSATWGSADEHSAYDVAQEVKRLTAEAETDRSEIAHLKTKIASVRSLLKADTALLQECTAEFARLTSALDDCNARLAVFSSEAAENSKNLAALHGGASDAKDGLLAAGQRCADLHAGNEGRRRDHAGELMSLAGAVDSLKQRRGAVASKARILADLRHTAGHRETQIRHTSERLATTGDDLRRLTKELDVIMLRNAEFTAQYDEVAKFADALSTQKQALRKRIKDMRPEMMARTFTVTRTDGAMAALQRTIADGKLQLDDERHECQEARDVTADAKMWIKLTKMKTHDLKMALQADKNKVISLLTEIETARKEGIGITKDTEIMLAKAELSNEENARHALELNGIQTRVAHQSEIAERLRSERNQYKRQVEAIEGENVALGRVHEELEEVLSQAHTKTETLLTETVNNHFSLRASIEAIVFLTEQTEACAQGILTTDRMISRFQAELQTLHCVLRESRNDMVQQKKEAALNANNTLRIRDLLYQKTAQVAQLQGEIKACEIRRLKSRDDYLEIAQEVALLQGELMRLDEANRRLQEKITRLSHVDSDIRRSMRFALVERHKAITLIYDLGVRRNVHRWEVMAAVEPSYVRSLKFKSRLSAKIDARHRELMALLQEKDELAEKVQAANRGSESTVSVTFRQMNEYRLSLRRMDQEFAEMEIEMKNNRELLAEHSTAVSTCRERLADRRTTTVQIDHDITEIRSQGSSPVYFITQPLIPSLRSQLGVGQSREAVIASSPMMLGGIPILGRSKRRGAASMMARPTVFYGKATFLPPMAEIVRTQPMTTPL
jgi:chromosome segregation ATPase